MMMTKRWRWEWEREDAYIYFFFINIVGDKWIGNVKNNAIHVLHSLQLRCTNTRSQQYNVRYIAETNAKYIRLVSGLRFYPEEYKTRETYDAHYALCNMFNCILFDCWSVQYTTYYLLSFSLALSPHATENWISHSFFVCYSILHSSAEYFIQSKGILKLLLWNIWLQTREHARSIFIFHSYILHVSTHAATSISHRFHISIFCFADSLSLLVGNIIVEMTAIIFALKINGKFLIFLRCFRLLRLPLLFVYLCSDCWCHSVR